MMSLIYFLLIGLVAGYVANKIVRGRGHGLALNILVGVLGAVVGGFIFALFGLEPVSVFGSLVTSIMGAIVVLVILKSIKKAA